MSVKSGELFIHLLQIRLFIILKAVFINGVSYGPEDQKADAIFGVGTSLSGKEGLAAL